MANDRRLVTVEYAKGLIDQNYTPDSENAQSGKAVAEALSGYVVAEVGKGLSSNDFTNEDKEKLNSALQNEDIDQTYSLTSTNAQSGKAVAEAVLTEQKRADNTFANALKGSKTGTAMLLDDVSPVTHDMSVKVRGKNLFDKDNYIIITGNQSHLAFDISKLIIGNKYTFSSNLPITWFKISNSAGGYNSVQLSKLAGFTTFTFTMQRNSNISSTATQYLFIGIDTSANKVISNISELDGYNIQIELGTTATTYTPYVPDLTAFKVSRYGKNLLNSLGTWSGQNVSVISRDDGIVTTQSPNTTTISSALQFYNRTLPAGTYAFSIDCTIENTKKSTRPNEIFFVVNNAPVVLVSDMKSDGTYHRKSKFTLTKKSNVIIRFYFNVDSITETSDIPTTASFSNVQLEIGSTATDYEPYNSKTDYTPNTDGTVNGVTSLYPNTTLMTDTDGVIIDCEYNRDINKAFAELQQAIISLGGNV